MTADHRFKIHLRGIIDLLGNHLYSRPELYLREVLQNAVDAITARRRHEADFRGEIQLEISRPRGKPPTLAIVDNGIGMTEDEVHQFLATVGESSKRADGGGSVSEFLGQFGIGMLAGFMVADEIVAVSRSARGAGPAVEWRGRLDGSYTTRTLEQDLSPGTRVYLTCRAGNEELFEPQRVRELARHFGGLLPYPIRVSDGTTNEPVNVAAPWRERYANDRERLTALLEFGRSVFGTDFLDAIPLESAAGGADGVAFVLPQAVNLAGERTHLVYLKNMLLGERTEGLLPPWAFFVKAIVNVEQLRPTASRESFVADERLETAREELGRCLRNHLISLAERESPQLERFLAVHHMALKALAAEDDESFRTFIDWLPFETTQGRRTVRELRAAGPTLRYVAEVGQFHQVAKIAAAQGMLLVNAGYAYEAELLARLPDNFADLSIELVDPAQLTHDFDELAPAEQQQVDALIDAAQAVLRPFDCVADVRKFKPVELPAFFGADSEARFYRSLDRAKEVADPLFSGVLSSLAATRQRAPKAVLCLNFQNPLVQRLAAAADARIVGRSVEILYVQALLLAQQPLTSRELSLLNRGMSGLLDIVLAAKE